MFKIIALTLTILVASSAASEQVPLPGVAGHAQYKYQYGVQGVENGDHKGQWEHRDGDQVQGSYTLLEADGTSRVVDYKSDPVHGFQAHVKREGHAKHPTGESYANFYQFY
ncbi:cuticle protein 18.6-like [Culex pipiens pallens]|uniref:cuticle protein 18.6-like n=1 Tax=Culex pipiens pallens TaxID=42434 RepID=UPI0019534366|nr:cuticle protein 18.6-like [Culex pipiens pallens]